MIDFSGVSMGHRLYQKAAGRPSSSWQTGPFLMALFSKEASLAPPACLYSVSCGPSYRVVCAAPSGVDISGI